MWYKTEHLIDLLKGILTGIQPVQTMGLELPHKMHGTLIGQPEENPETTMAYTDMPPFLINKIIDDEDGEIDLQALIHGVKTL